MGIKQELAYFLFFYGNIFLSLFVGISLGHNQNIFDVKWGIFIIGFIFILVGGWLNMKSSRRDKDEGL